MNEEEDYMSDDFITKCLSSTSDVRPGLLKTRNEQRQHEMIKKKKLLEEINKKPNETEVLENSLKQPIDSSNKGFSMLQKMGFKTGMGLGKNNSGIVEPIGINIKNDRKGLGVNKPKKRIQSTEVEKISEDDYRAFLSKKNKEREIVSDLRKSQKVCRELDLKHDKKEPDEKWFWPAEEEEEEKDKKEEQEAEVDSEEEKEYDNEEKLEAVTRYLRKVYNYCIWCKIQFEDEKDMQDCPGMTREDH